MSSKRIILDYEIGNGSVRMPIDAIILSVGIEGNKPVIHALVDPKTPEIVREFILMGTGDAFDTMSPEKVYIGTITRSGHFDHGSYVQHIFEVILK
jgi:hypothetical protein